MPIEISADFDSANIEVVHIGQAGDVALRIQTDTQAPFLQWFYFQVTGAAGRPMVFRIINAGQCSFPRAWRGFRAVSSWDADEWERVPTEYQDGTLIIRHTPKFDVVWYAMFAPYPFSRHQAMVAKWSEHAQVTHKVLGFSVEGRPMDALFIGSPDANKRTCWIIARQHAGETMAEWWIEGFMNALLKLSSPLAHDLLQKATFAVVPNMNPDGSYHGNLRANAAGQDLNRAWQSPTATESPEVFAVRQCMEQTGVDFLLDVHGDETLPYVFTVGPESVANLPFRIASLHERFRAAYQRACPDFQWQYGYPQARQADLRICKSYIAHRYQCLAMTLEQPFKDNANAPDPVHGWSPRRSQALGGATLAAIAEVLPDLR